MSESLQDAQQAIATASSPAAEFAQLSRGRKREVFFGLPETVRESLVAEMDEAALRRFVRGLDPDEGADVLGFADEATREAVLRRGRRVPPAAPPPRWCRPVAPPTCCPGSRREGPRVCLSGPVERLNR